ncbi:hypothetical protein [Intestinimonas massiliensis (ex Afouda et al. 2020)]|jgi:hypothetical protein|uniref:Uncharacterized protein n=1 Tax=Intestinimonas massiliensis (ex Afouda et al. 2020) TaxID=1673721 RepID=A0ABS9M6F0_9FIRM|nr:hypothetical protein [Intestinimonas massiliensis (ex Afouda et al. 2020)]MCG4526372.1 hypothetical protein [Intestinimonas massiliensis (ex Afouda et al. 2020)]
MSHTKFNLMAVPCDRAFVISEQDAGLLSQKNAGALRALRAVRRAENKSASPERLQELDAKIARLALKE